MKTPGSSPSSAVTRRAACDAVSTFILHTRLGWSGNLGYRLFGLGPLIDNLEVQRAPTPGAANASETSLFVQTRAPDRRPSRRCSTASCALPAPKRGERRPALAPDEVRFPRRQPSRQGPRQSSSGDQDPIEGGACPGSPEGSPRSGRRVDSCWPGHPRGTPRGFPSIQGLRFRLPQAGDTHGRQERHRAHRRQLRRRSPQVQRARARRLQRHVVRPVQGPRAHRREVSPTSTPASTRSASSTSTTRPAITQRYGVRGVPTVIVFKGGREDRPARRRHQQGDAPQDAREVRRSCGRLASGGRSDGTRGESARVA